MKCKFPFQKGPYLLGCGSCIPCRINKQREWVGRMTLERNEHKYSAFVTLTYNDLWMPEDQCVSKKELQNFLKRLRKELSLAKQNVRFYAVAEYGSVSRRPHYHLVVYGLSPLEVKTVQKCWMYGFVKMGTVEAKSMAYVSGYVQKTPIRKKRRSKQTTLQDFIHKGRSFEFNLMSRRKGLGYGVVSRVKDSCGRIPRETINSVGAVFRADGRLYPFGRYLRRALQSELGATENDMAQASTERFMAEFERKRGKTRTEIMRVHRSQVDQQEGRIQMKKRRETL